MLGSFLQKADMLSAKPTYINFRRRFWAQKPHRIWCNAPPGPLYTWRLVLVGGACKRNGDTGKKVRLPKWNLGVSHWQVGVLFGGLVYVLACWWVRCHVGSVGPIKGGLKKHFQCGPMAAEGAVDLKKAPQSAAGLHPLFLGFNTQDLIQRILRKVSGYRSLRL